VPIGPKSVLKKAIPYVDSLTLSYRDNVFSFEFAALSYANSQKNRYRYKLEPLEPGWNEVGSKQRLATYTNLDPGKYVFRVQGSNGDGLWNEEGVSLPVLITPPWWRTNWFRALCALTFLAILWTVYQVRVHTFKRRQALLERHQAVLEQHQTEIRALNEQMVKAQEAERMRIAGDLHDSVLQQITSFTLRLGTAKFHVPPDSKAKATIIGLQQELIKIGTDIRHISHELHPALLHEAGLPAALTVYCDEFSKVRGLPVACDVDESVKELSPGAALCLYRIAQEALGNAAKYSEAKKVEVRLTRSNGTVCLSVSDDGVGCALDQLGKSGGLGVINMRERVLQLHGTFEFKSEPGRGTTVKAEVPFRPSF
jgi:signal transduction histidine kinase